MKRAVLISRHAAERYVERVDRRASSAEARFAIERILRLGKVRTVPRQWMRRNGVAPQPGVTFIYSAEYPGTCLVIRDGVVLTVLTRSLCSAPRPTHLRVVHSAPRALRLRPEDRARWRWNGKLDLDDAA